MKTEPTDYLGEVMVHKPSRKPGPIVRATKLSGSAIQLTLRTYDGLAIKGPASEFNLANGLEYASFVEGFLSGVPVSMI